MRSPMETTVVSVIMPCFNEAHFLRTALDSILAQTFPHDQMEVLIVDGGSSDGSSSIVDEYEGVIIRLLLLDNPRQHIAAALNIGLEAAHGDFVVRMDAHTVYAADYVERCVEGLRRDVAEAVGGCQQGRGLGFWGRTIAIATQHLFGSGGPAYKASSRPG